MQSHAAWKRVAATRYNQSMNSCIRTLSALYSAGTMEECPGMLLFHAASPVPCTEHNNISINVCFMRCLKKSLLPNYAHACLQRLSAFVPICWYVINSIFNVELFPFTIEVARGS